MEGLGRGLGDMGFFLLDVERGEGDSELDPVESQGSVSARKESVSSVADR